MAHERRTWTAAQKLVILKEAEQNGVAQTCRRHQLAESLLGKDQGYQAHGSPLSARP